MVSTNEEANFRYLIKEIPRLDLETVIAQVADFQKIRPQRYIERNTYSRISEFSFIRKLFIYLRVIQYFSGWCLKYGPTYIEFYTSVGPFRTSLPWT